MATGSSPAGDARSATWRLWTTYSAQITSTEFAWRSEMSHPGRVLPYSARITFAEGNPLTAEGTVIVPACHTTPTPTATTTPTATATATVSLTPTPTGTPEAGGEWEVYLPLLRRGPQPAQSSAFAALRARTAELPAGVTKIVAVSGRRPLFGRLELTAESVDQYPVYFLKVHKRVGSCSNSAFQRTSKYQAANSFVDFEVSGGEFIRRLPIR